jgi:hypothetical protein
MVKPRQCQADLLLQFVNEGLDRLYYNEVDWYVPSLFPDSTHMYHASYIRSCGDTRDFWYPAKVTKFEIKPETKRLARDICKQLRGDLFMNAKNPKTIAPGVIRYSLVKTGQALKTGESGRAESKRRVRNRNIAQAFGISRDSVIIAYKDLNIYMKATNIHLKEDV